MNSILKVIIGSVIILSACNYRADRHSKNNNRTNAKTRLEGDNKPEFTSLSLLNRKSKYILEVDCKEYNYFGENLWGPQFTIILREDSIFYWDSWYGSDAYIAAGIYFIQQGALFLKSNINDTEEFEVLYKKLNPEWPYYVKTQIDKKLIYSDSLISFMSND